MDYITIVCFSLARLAQSTTSIRNRQECNEHGLLKKLHLWHLIGAELQFLLLISQTK